MRIMPVALAMTWVGLWLTPDQQGELSYKRGDYTKAAQEFQDPMWRGTAWYRAGEFEKSAQEFARVSSPEADFNAGNAWLMRGKYDQAIASYEQALKLRPRWKAAVENRDLAVARKNRIQQTGGDLGDQREGADEIVFDPKKPPGGENTVVAGEQAADAAAVQALWLRRVQTNPADFLKRKFAYQQARAAEGDDQ